MSLQLRTRVGIGCCIVLLLCIPLANWSYAHVGVCAPGGPCLLPVFPGLQAPSGVITIGVALILRDVAKRLLGSWAAFAAVALGALLAAAVVPAELALASFLAFALSELADFAILSPLARRGLMLAVAASSLAAIVVDSAVFLGLAFGSLALMPGQVVGKAWAVLFSLPLIRWLQRIAPA